MFTFRPFSPGYLSVGVVDVVVLAESPFERGVVGGDVGDVILPVNIVHVKFDKTIDKETD